MPSNKHISEHKKDGKKEHPNIKLTRKEVGKIMKKGKKGGTSMFTSAAAGAVIGATVGGLTGAALSNEKTRKALGQGMSGFAKNASERMQTAASRAQEVTSAADKMLNMTTSQKRGGKK